MVRVRIVRPAMVDGRFVSAGRIVIVPKAHADDLMELGQAVSVDRETACIDPSTERAVLGRGLPRVGNHGTQDHH